MNSQSEIEKNSPKPDKRHLIYDYDHNKYGERDQLRDIQEDEQHLKNHICD